MRDVFPIFLTFTPVTNVMLTLCPFEAMRIVVHDSDAPRHNDIVADNETSVADEIATPHKCTATDLDYSAAFLKTYIGMDD